MNAAERRVMEQALEALEKSGCVAFKGLACRCNSTCASYTAAVALRAALAQQAEPACERVMTITTVPITVPRVLTDADLDAIRKIVREGGKE